MTIPVSWRKSSRSGTASNCVEVRSDLAAVRDTKNPGPFIRVDIRSLVDAIREGRVG
jgi:hypothetical protein